MGFVSHCVAYEDFLYLFNKFSDKVRTNRYNPIPYHEYKEFKRSVDRSDCDIIVDYDTYMHEIIVYTEDQRFHFPVDGESFGAFLFDELCIDFDLHNGDVWEPNSKELAKENKNILEKVKKNINDTTDLCGSVNEKEKNIMKFNFDFGPVTGNDVRMSLYGLAVKNKSGSYVSYDAKSGDIMDVDILNFEGAKFLYKMPVAIKDIAIGDVIVHHRVPMFVVAIAVNGGYVTAVDPIAGERKEVMLTKSPFGFNFVTKVVNLLGSALNGTASAENPFGNLGLMMMLSEDGNGVKDMLPLMLMANGSNLDMSNPLMLYALMGGKNSDNMLPLMLMMNAQKPTVPSEGGCTCGGNCKGE